MRMPLEWAGKFIAFPDKFGDFNLTSDHNQKFSQVTYYQIIRIFSIFDNKQLQYSPGDSYYHIFRIFSIFDS